MLERLPGILGGEVDDSSTHAGHLRPARDESRGWSVEVKADGCRCQVSIGGRGVVLTRGGHDIAGQLPELAALSDLGVGAVLDCELVAGAGRPADFYALAGAISSRRRDRAVLTYVPIDLLWLDGCGLIDELPSTGEACSSGSAGSAMAMCRSCRRSRPATSTSTSPPATRLDLKGCVEA